MLPAVFYANYSHAWQPFWLLGVDALDLLHRRSSNAVAGLAAGQGVANALLNRTGHVQAFLSTHCLNPQALLLLSETAVLATAQQEVVKYKIMERLELHPLLETGKPSQPMQVLLCVGNAWQQALATAFPSLTASAFTVNAVTVIPQPQEGLLEASATATVETLSVEASGLEQAVYWVSQPTLLMGREPAEGGCLVGLQERVEQVLQTLQKALKEKQLTATEWNARQLEAFQVEQGVLKAGQDWNQETLLPTTALETWTVSYTKGCYLGQETIARVKTYGAVPQLVLGLEWPEDQAPEEQAIRSLEPLEAAVKTAQLPLLDAETGKPVGHLSRLVYASSRNRYLGLATLGKAYRVPGSELTVLLQGKPYTVTVRLLPFPSLLQPKTNPEAKIEQATIADAMQLFLEEQPEEAIERLKAYVQVTPKAYSAAETLAVLLGRLHRYDEAIEGLKALIALEPNWVMAYSNLSRFELARGDKEQAEVYKAQATTVAMRVGMQKAMAAKAASLGEGVMQGVAPTSALNEPLEAKPQQPVEKPVLDTARKTLLEERLALFNHALHYNANDPLAHFGKASVFTELGRWEEAIEAYQKTLELQPNNKQAHQQLGQALKAAGQIVQHLKPFSQ